MWLSSTHWCILICVCGHTAARSNSDEIVYRDTNDEGEGKLVDVEYIAAALQYQPFDDLAGGGLALLQENAINYVENARLAKSMGAQIIVFPEYGLTSLNLGLLFMSQTQVVPPPENKEVPCFYTDVEDSSKIMQFLSCEALNSEMYFVVDLAEQFNCSGLHCTFYNTQVVFDDTGAVVARYRKKHLFSEPIFHSGTEPDAEATFDTSFGVSFSLQICFDILYESPALNNIENLGIKDVVMSTAWMDQLPFLVAPQFWKGWTTGNKVNLLVANLYNPPKGFLGAGILRGYSSETETYSYDTESGTTLVVGKVKTKSVVASAKRSHAGKTVDQNHQQMPTVYFLAEDIKRAENVTVYKESGQMMSNEKKTTAIEMKYKHAYLFDYNYTVLSISSEPDTLYQTLCHEDGLCCTVEYTYPAEEPEESVYMLLAYSGIVMHAHKFNNYVQNCAVVLCFNESITSCARIEDAPSEDSAFSVSRLSGTFSVPHIFPSVLTDGLKLYDPTQWKFSLTEYSDYYLGSVDVQGEVNDLLTLTLYGRWYSRDTVEPL